MKSNHRQEDKGKLSLGQMGKWLLRDFTALAPIFSPSSAEGGVNIPVLCRGAVLPVLSH